MKTPTKLARHWKNDSSIDLVADNIYSEFGDEEFPPLLLGGADDYVSFSSWLGEDGIRSVGGLATSDLYILYAQGGYFYVTDVSHKWFPVYYVTFDSPEDIGIFKIANRFSYFFDQLEDNVDAPAWLEDWDLYEVRCSNIDCLPKCFSILFEDSTARFHGMFAKLLSLSFESVSVELPVIYEGVLSRGLDKGEFEDLVKEWRDMKKRSMLYGAGCGDHPENNLVHSLLHLIKRLNLLT